MWWAQPGKIKENIYIKEKRKKLCDPSQPLQPVRGAPACRLPDGSWVHFTPLDHISSRVLKAAPPRRPPIVESVHVHAHSSSPGWAVDLCGRHSFAHSLRALFLSLLLAQLPAHTAPAKLSVAEDRYSTVLTDLIGFVLNS